MLDEIFAGMPESYVTGTLDRAVSYYFSLGEHKKTVQLEPDRCLVSDGKTVDNADCVCKASPEFFLRIWQEGYRPGMKDFLAGTIKSNNPSALQLFLKSFGKDS
jgi:putative sterol carrier protein